jgi:hypothetical protein
LADQPNKQKANDGAADVARHLVCQIGYPNGEQEYREHEREPEQEAVSAARISAIYMSLRKRLTRTMGWHQIRIGIQRLGHGDFSNCLLSEPEGGWKAIKNRERRTSRNISFS